MDRKTVRIDTQTLWDLVKALDAYRAKGVLYKDELLLGGAIASLSQFAHFHGVPEAAEAFEVTVPDNDLCDACRWRTSEWRDGGWCYMYKEKPKTCYNHTPKDDDR